VQVLVVHNRYRSGVPSGENLVVEREIQQLRAAGVDVATYIRSSDEFDEMPLRRRVRHIGSPVYSRTAVADVRALLSSHRSQVLHLHNPFPLISFAVVSAARQAGVPVVQTVHNHRHTCMKGTYHRDGHPCQDCLGARLSWPGVRHGCYRDSHAQSAVMAVALTQARRYREGVSRFIALTPEIASSLHQAGVPADKVVVKPNSVPDPGHAPQLGTGLAYVGRVSEEKGVPMLVEAWSTLPEGRLGTLTVAGHGPAEGLVRRIAAGRSDVVVLGQVDHDTAIQVMRSAAVVAVPSRWPEAMPLTVLEAMALGRPVMAGKVGGLPAVIDSGVGWVVDPDLASWCSALASLEHADLQPRAAGARRAYEQTYSPGPVLRQLVGIYDGVISHR
jgi:glycosyltransferase involved in cell wall biosynthesis